MKSKNKKLRAEFQGSWILDSYLEAEDYNTKHSRPHQTLRVESCVGEIEGYGFTKIFRDTVCVREREREREGESVSGMECATERECG